MTDISTDAEGALQKLQSLWRMELQATRKQEQEQRGAVSQVDRVRRGNALRKLQIDDVEAKIGGRALLWFRPAHSADLEHFKLSGGEPVLLWQGKLEGGNQVRGTLVRRTTDRVAVMVDGGCPDFIEEGPVELDREAPETTFERGKIAIDRFLENADLSAARKVIFGEQAPTFSEQTAELEFRDNNLNPSQKTAVQFAMSAQQIALIHGPPGTGKTQTLVEIVRQALLRDQTVLVTAASNTAVDNLTERMLNAGLKPLRLGHPARISTAVESRTLDVLIEQTDESKLARKWLAQARDMRTRHLKRKDRGNLGRSEGLELLAQANRLAHDARRAFEAARAKVLRRCRVVCTTCAGVDVSLLGNTRFDLVIVDEATQAVDPITLCAMERGKVWVLAGDPRQLSPTVVDQQAEREGLGVTIFERLAAQWQEAATRLLTVQYRMHEQLIEYPSKSLYRGLLETHPSVQARRLEDLPGVSPDPERAGPWVFLDTAGTGFGEEVASEDASTSNPGQAERTAAEVQRLIARGVSPLEIAAITPYSAQVKRLKQLLTAEMALGLEVGTVDGFQGREKEAIVVDLVRSNAQGQIGFLSDVRRTNVAITRARSFLLIIGDSATLAGHEYYKALIEHAQSVGAWQSAWS